jgi:hypothetical protein
LFDGVPFAFLLSSEPKKQVPDEGYLFINFVESFDLALLSVRCFANPFLKFRDLAPDLVELTAVESDVLLNLLRLPRQNRGHEDEQDTKRGFHLLCQGSKLRLTVNNSFLQTPCQN